MKYILLFTCLFCVQCASQSGQNLAAVSDEKEIRADNYVGTVEDRLAQMLRRESGVIVRQTGNSYTVKIRGLGNSFGTDTSPLFVINGTSMGHNFQSAAEAMAGVQLKSLRVLKGKDASIYGTRGSAGVIEIKTITPELNNE